MAAATRPGRDGDQQRSHADPGLDQEYPATIGPPNSAEIAEKEPAIARTGCCFLSTVTNG